MNTNNRFIQLYLTLYRAMTRNKISLFFSLMFPLIFMGLFGLAMQEGDPANSTIELGLLNDDLGIPGSATVLDLNGDLITQHAIASQYIKILEEVTFEDGTTHIFNLNVYSDQSEAVSDLERQKVKALVILPEDFTVGYMASMRKSLQANGINLDWTGFPEINYNSSLDVMGDQSLIQFNIASSVISAITKGYFDFNNDVSGMQVTITSSVETEGFTTFDYLVPGLVIFAIISNANTVAAVSLNDVESGMLNRLKLTKMKKFEYPTAVVLSQMVFAFMQIPILFGSAIAFGFPVSSDLLITFIFAIFVSAAMSGLGMLIASVASNAQAVGALASIITTPMSFLAGAFFPIPNNTIFTIGSNFEFHLFDFLPPTRAISALRLILFNDYSLGQVMPDLIITIVLSIFYVSLGVWVYSRKHLTTK